jgi:formylglycine-generating enzyme required for sulfatase activity
MAASKGRRVAIAAGAVALVVLAATVVLGWRDLVFWYRFEALGKNAQGYFEYRHRQTGIVMVLLPGGKFLMGAQKEDPNGPNYDPEATNDEGPVHEVTLSPFLIGKYEVTQAEWKKIMRRGFRKDESGPTLPANWIRWDLCQEFCRKAGLRLPTEAQWEFSCRAGAPGPLPGELAEFEWFGFDEKGGTRLHPVGSKKPNGFGLCDMLGNVYEWCEDVYDEKAYSSPEARKPDPLRTSGSAGRVTRGGAWYCQAKFCRAAWRAAQDTNTWNPANGFRVAYPVP